MREVPALIYFDCVDCREVTPHDVLKGKIGKASLEATLRCQQCERVFSATVQLPKIIPTKVVVSSGPVSETTTIELESDDIIVLGDEFFLDDGRRVKVTGVELKDGVKAKKAQATTVSTIWVILFDVINIKVSINDVERTYARYLEAEPDDEFSVGQTIGFGDMDCLIHSIKVKDRMIRRGYAEARDIVRIYGKLRKRSCPILVEDDVEDV